MSRKSERYRVNLLRPQAGGMRDEVAVILAVLAGWGAVTFGSQILLASDTGRACAAAPLAIFGLPLTFFFTAQFLPLWFIILCLVFNLYLDRIAVKHGMKKDRSYE